MKNPLFSNELIIVEFNGNQYLSMYMGRQKGFECIVCGAGENCHTFNIYNNPDDVNDCNYETWGFGTQHLSSLKYIGPIDV